MDITECTILNNYLYFRGALWIPNFESLWTTILYKIYNSLITGHPGRENTFVLLARDFYGYIIYKITTVLFEIARYAPVYKHGESKGKAF